MLDFSRIRTYPLRERKNLVRRRDFRRASTDVEPWGDRRFRRLVRLIQEARAGGRHVLWQMGAHVIKTGQSLLVIDLIRRGAVTHVAMNGACTIHDYEMALIGETSEDVALSIEDGSFGMAEETGRDINEAINSSREGYGKALGRWIVERALPHRDYSILAAAFDCGVPATVHVAIGTDITHQHPTCDGARLGAATYEDFKVYTETVSQLAGGVLLNVGSAVIMPEVFLKALSIARNLGFPVAPLTTANLDCRRHINDYYFRPAKNVVKRPISLGGQGFNLRVAHEVSIPSLHKLLTGGKRLRAR